MSTTVFVLLVAGGVLAAFFLVDLLNDRRTARRLRGGPGFATSDQHRTAPVSAQWAGSDGNAPGRDQTGGSVWPG